MRDSSKTSEDYAYESIPLVPDGDSASLQTPRLQALVVSLWQNLNAVRQSGILNDLSQRECRLQEVRRDGGSAGGARGVGEE
ncbi:hypothetical protein chiPu_0024863, partial [Chiloscyllium punctatum]|nr:hypothetical protein [Chiloscyllium punctatum]